MTFNGLIMTILNFFGITQPPATTQELIWDIIILVVGLVIVKAILAFVFGFFKEVGKL